MRVRTRTSRTSTSIRSLALQCVPVAILLLASAVFAQPEEELPAEAAEAVPVGEVEPEPEPSRPDLSEDLAPIAPGEDTGPAAGVEEIVITGEARASMVEDDTISVVGFDAEVVILEGIKDIRDLSNFTPSLEIKSAFAASNPTIYIRGVGLDDFNANAASAVAIYQDDVYMQSPAGQLFQFFDVEGVEVLRGPQGTLYRNASAGAILINSKRPSQEFSSYLMGTYGNYDLIEVEGAIGGPIVPDYLSGRLSGTWGIRDGITRNRCADEANEPNADLISPPCNQETADGSRRFVEPGIDKWTNDLDYLAARGQLLLSLPLAQTETEWLLNVHGGQNSSRAYQYQHRGVRLQPVTEEPLNIGGIDANGYRDKDGGDPFAGDYNVDGPEDISLFGTNLTGTVLFGGDALELRSLTAYEWHDLFRLENTDGGPKFVLESEYTDTAWQFSQQFDLQGKALESEIGDADWTLGVYYLQEDLDVVNFFNQQGPAELFQEYTQEMWNFAGYGQMEYRLRPGCARVSCDFTFVGGLRYNWEHKSFATSVIEVPAGGQVRDTLDGEDATLWAGPSGELSIAWDFTDDSNIYAKYSRGWKGGHFNGGATSIFDVITGVEPEILNSYEAGLRSFWFDDRLMVNLTGFFYDYQDLQVFIIEQTPLGYPIPKLANASDAEVYGLELDLTSNPIEGLYLTFNAAWVESEYKEFVVSFSEKFRLPKACRTCPPPNPPFIILKKEFDYTGNTLIASPRFSATGSIEYDIPLPWQVGRYGLGTLSPRFSFSWKDTLLYDQCGGRGNRCNFDAGFFGQKPFWVFNAALTWASENERITVTGWTRNFLDTHYKSQSFDVSRGLGIILDVYAEPRTFGVTAALAF
jgi:iron complex outermembrane receptor protein